MVGVVRKFHFTVNASLLLVFLFLLILFLLLVFLWDNIIQVAEIMLGEYIVHCFADSNQSQNHDRENDGSNSRFEDPQAGQAQGLDESEEMDASLGNVPQVDQVRLVLCRHEEQLQAIHELDTIE